MVGFGFGFGFGIHDSDLDFQIRIHGILGTKQALISNVPWPITGHPPPSSALTSPELHRPEPPPNLDRRIQTCFAARPRQPKIEHHRSIR